MKLDNSILSEDFPTIQKAKKAYDNRSFIHSSEGRLIRIMAEYSYPKQHFRKNNIENAIIFFGSARIKSLEQYNAEFQRLSLKVEKAEGKQKVDLEKKLNALKLQGQVCQYYDDAVDLAKMLTEWSSEFPLKTKFHICSGGGPGIMEAANRGAAIAGGKSIGLNISLPFEQFPNQYISPELNFEFHYFFMRKFWFVNLAQAMVVFPGGFGTLDEMMEIMTLRQTHKLTRPLPIVLFGEKFWKSMINFDYLVETGMISEADLSLFKICNTPAEAYNYITKELTDIHKLAKYAQK